MHEPNQKVISQPTPNPATSTELPQPEPKTKVTLVSMFRQIPRQTLIFIGLVVIAMVFSIVGAYLMLIGQKYQAGISVDPGETRQHDAAKNVFGIRKITIVQDGETYEFNPSGEALWVDANRTRIHSRHLFSYDEIMAMFSSLTLEEFEALLNHYFSENKNITLIIETSHGSKTIVVDDQGTDPLPDPIEEIIDNIDEIIDEIVTPPPSAPPPPPATVMPTVVPTPIPTLPPFPTPTPLPGSTPAPADPFRCDMLQNQINSVTVSNTVCVKE